MKKDSKKFWDKEYQTSEHLALSAEPSEDLQKFARWMEREHGAGILSNRTKVLDLGTGNGRNLIWLAETFGCKGVGYDISAEAIGIAREAAAVGSPAAAALRFETRSIAAAEPFPFENESQDFVLDMMTSHFLSASERAALRDEIFRMLKPGGYLFFKTFLADEDLHVKRLLADHPASEKGSYIHPEIGVAEHVYYEKELREFFEPQFEIKKIDKSHKHIGKDGGAWKRRTVSAYLEKKW